MTVRDLIQMDVDIDVYDDVCEELSIAFCGPQKLTPEGESHFASVMNFPVTINSESYGGLPAAIIGVDDPDEAVWKSRLKQAKRFFWSAAGYCDCEDYDRWFEEEKKMKKSEVIEMYRNAITESLLSHYRTVLESAGHVQYRIYVWEDGRIETLEQVQGDMSRLQEQEQETRQLFFVAAVAAPCFDWRDFVIDSLPEDESELELLKKEVINWFADEYESNLPDLIDSIIEQTEIEEKFDDGF